MAFADLSAAAEARLQVMQAPPGEVLTEQTDLTDPSFGFPGVADPQQEPNLADLRRELLKTGTEIVRPALKTVALPSKRPVAPGPLAGRGFLTDNRTPPGTRRVTSRNWSGGVVGAHSGRRFHRVGATWKIPSLSPKNPEDSPRFNRPGFNGHGNPMDARCSIWVGLDGFARWAGSMPQLGTEHVAPGSAGGHRFWLQWWTRESTLFQIYLDDARLKLAAGDTVTCHLELAEDGLSALFHFLRVVHGTENRYLSVIRMTAEPDRPAVGSTAQAILERPSAPYIEQKHGSGGHVDVARSAGMHPMPDFGSVTLSSFGASLGSRELSVRQMQMVSNFARRSKPPRTAVVSQAKRTAAGALALTYTGGS